MPAAILGESQLADLALGGLDVALGPSELVVAVEAQARLTISHDSAVASSSSMVLEVA